MLCVKVTCTCPLPFCQFIRTTNKALVDKADQWVGYCAFHLGDYQRARQVCADC